jgi:hypothetical protein
VISLRGVLEQGEGEINRTISHDAEEPESKDREPKPPKIRAEDNPWYLLATLYGAPEFDNYELQAKNTVAWNRYFAANLDVKKTNKELIEEKGYAAEEHPFSWPQPCKFVECLWVPQGFQPFYR